MVTMDRLTSLGMDYGPQEVRDLRDRLLGMRSSLAGKLDAEEMRSLAAAIELIGTMSSRIWGSQLRREDHAPD